LFVNWSRYSCAISLLSGKLNGSAPWTRRLNNNSLSGKIPMGLTNLDKLQVLWVLLLCLDTLLYWQCAILYVTWHMVIESSDLSKNNLTGNIPTNGSFSYFTPIRLVQFKFVCFHKHTGRTTLQRLANSHFGSIDPI